MKKMWKIVALLLLLFASYLLFALYQSNRRNSRLLEGVMKTSKSYELDALKTSRKIAVENTGKQLANLTLVNSNRDTIYLKSVLSDKRKKLFVCRFSEYNCSSCVNYSIKMLLKSADFIGKENILFLGNFTDNRIFQREMKLYGIDSSFMVLNTGDVQILADKLEIPYFFILDGNLNVLSISMPNKATPKLDYSYIELIGERYFGYN